MDTSTSLAMLDHKQVLPQNFQRDSSNPLSSIRLAAENSRTSIVNLLRDIESKVTTALKFFGVDARFFPKLIQKLRGAIVPACITAVSCFVAIHLFPSLGISVIVGVFFFVNLAVSRARLEIMKEDLEAARQAGARIESGTEQLRKQNAELLGVNQEQLKTIDEQKETMTELGQGLEAAQNSLSGAQENLAREQRIKEAQGQLIAQQEAKLQTQEAYIVQCQSCLASVFTSQQDLIHNLEQSLRTQTATVQQILQNVQNIANGERLLTEALAWAQGRIAEAQTKLTAVIDISADMTAPEKCRQLIENGEFAQKAQVMQQAAQEAYDIMNDLNTGLTTRIIEAQQAIAASRQQAEANLMVLISQQQEKSHALEQASNEIRQKEQEIAHLHTEHQAALELNTGQVQALTAEIEKEKQSLEALTQEKGILGQNLQAVEVQLRESREKVRLLELTNGQLRTQCQMQERTMEEQRATIEAQELSLEEIQNSLNSLQGQLRQGPGVWRTFVTGVGLAVGAVATKAILPG